MMTSPRFPLRRRRSGVALVLVLSILILLTAIVVAFFTNATTDLTASKNYSDGVKVKLLGDSAVNLVEGQIREATQGGTSSAPLAWASQPGLIRTYDTNGQQQTVYKLYSADELQVPQGDPKGEYPFNPNTALPLEIPTDWNARPSDFVDLNSPTVVADPNGTLTDPSNPNSGVKYSARFPIIDGNNLVRLGNTRVYDGIVPGVTQDGVPDIEGFGVQSPTTYNENRLIAPNNNPVPMPVRWLYVLQDGELQPRDATTGTIANASKANPVVSRIAFWTDDDTCKLNINTASEGTFWDRPRGKNNMEVAYSLNLPAQNEFQMFPGHPAKDCLSTVLGSIWPVPSSVISGTSDQIPYVVPSVLTAQTYSKLLPYYDLAPRVTRGDTSGQSGGSAGGTQRPTAPNGVIYDEDRLYTSVDEMMFQPKMANDNVTRLARNDVNNTGAPQPLTPQYLETSRFFLTASNRAPEVTLLNTPRVSVWPLQANPAGTTDATNRSTRTLKDKLLAFCSTVPTGSNNYYYFQRLLCRPGSTTLSSDSPDMDFSTGTSGARNGVLYQYLQKLLRSDVPGLGGNFSTKYGSANTDEILTEMVDMMRSTLNVYGSPNPGPEYDYTHYGETVPLIPPVAPNTQGFGRFATLSEAALDFFLCNDPNAKDPNTKQLLNLPQQLGAMLVLQPFAHEPGYSSVSLLNIQFRVSGLNRISIRKTGDGGSQSLNFPTGTLVNTMDAYTGYGNCTEYNGLLSAFYYGQNNTKKTLAYSGTAPDSYYPFFNAVTPITKTGVPPGPGDLPGGTTNFDFFDPDTADGSTPVTVEIWSNPESPSIPQRKIQTLHLSFPACTNIPVPGWAGITAGPTVANPVVTVLNSRLTVPDANVGLSINDPLTGSNSFGIFGVNDVVRSVVLDSSKMSKGDYRVMSTRSDVPTGFFAPHPFDGVAGRPIVPTALDPKPSDANHRFAESLRAGQNQGYGAYGYYAYDSTAPYLLGNGWSTPRKSSYNGTLIALPDSNLPYYTPEAAPSVPPLTGYTNGQATGVQLTGLDGAPHPGDWDSGAGALEDGPYINKPDEGNSVIADPSNYATAYHVTSVYYTRFYAGVETGATYSPNRQASSAVMFGSLPTGIDQTTPTGANTKPWQTLLFCADPAAENQHPGFGVSANGSSGTGGGAYVIPAPPYRTVPDHYVLDLFTMPIVEPYAISEPLSSQGKVNMNYQIAPFTYIKRDTALRAVLKSTRMAAIPSSTNALKNYKALLPTNMTTQFRYPINPDEKDGTLKFFEDRFGTGDLFRSASEICSVPLVPSDDPTQTYEVSAKAVTADSGSLHSFWNNCKLTGDNLREEPYGDIYPRLTTKSNTFTVHVRVQTLKKTAGTAATTFVDPAETASGAKDVITAEYRGSYQIERYVDPNLTTTFPDYASGSTTPINTFYKFHVIGTKQF